MATDCIDGVARSGLRFVAILAAALAAGCGEPAATPLEATPTRAVTHEPEAEPHRLAAVPPPEDASGGLAAVAPEPPRRRTAVGSHRACRRDPAACVRSAVELTRTDLARAATLFDVACEEGSAAGCGNLGVMLRDGRGIEADAARAERLLRRACKDGHAPSCPR